MPYISRYVQVLPSTTPNAPFNIVHGLDNTDVTSVNIYSDDPNVPTIPFTWAVVNAATISVTSSMDLEGCWIVVRAL